MRIVLFVLMWFLECLFGWICLLVWLYTREIAFFWFWVVGFAADEVVCEVEVYCFAFV